MEHYAELTKAARKALGGYRLVANHQPEESLKDSMLNSISILDDVLLQLGDRIQDTQNCIKAIVKNIHDVAYNDESQRVDDISKIIRQFDCYPVDQSELDV
jgi:hypothetical protein